MKPSGARGSYLSQLAAGTAAQVEPPAPVPAYDIRGHLDRDTCLKHRFLDVQLGIRVADDEPRRRSADGVTGPGGRDAAHGRTEWVRGRGLAAYVTVSFGALTLGSMLWGQVARIGGVPMAHCIAAAGVLLAIPLTWRWKLQT